MPAPSVHVILQLWRGIGLNNPLSVHVMFATLYHQGRLEYYFCYGGIYVITHIYIHIHIYNKRHRVVGKIPVAKKTHTHM